MRKQNRWSLIFDVMWELHCYVITKLLFNCSIVNMHLDNLWFHRHQPEMHHFVHWTLSKPQSIAPAGFHMPMQFNTMKGLICSLCISLTVAQLHCCIVAQLAQLRTSPQRCTKHGTRPPHHTEPDNNLTNPQKTFSTFLQLENMKIYLLKNCSHS